MVSPEGLEPSDVSLKGRYSTFECRRDNGPPTPQKAPLGAGQGGDNDGSSGGIRTHNPLKGADFESAMSRQLHH